MLIDDDETLMVLAEQLGDFIVYIGGDEFAECLLPPLENLANVEETLVRQKAIEALIKVAEELTTKALEDKFIPMLKRLAKGSRRMSV